MGKILQVADNLSHEADLSGTSAHPVHAYVIMLQVLNAALLCMPVTCAKQDASHMVNIGNDQLPLQCDYRGNLCRREIFLLQLLCADSVS